MQQNPYAPPVAGFAPPPGMQIDPEQAAAIQARIKRLNRISLGLGIPGLLLQIVGNTRGDGTGTALMGLGTVMLLVGLSFYARMKGRSGWWGLLGFLSILGLIGLAVLPSHCHGCTKPVKGKRCESCGAPSGA